MRRSTSVMTDGSGDVEMDRLGDGKTKRVGVSARIYVFVCIYIDIVYFSFSKHRMVTKKLHADTNTCLGLLRSRR